MTTLFFSIILTTVIIVTTYKYIRVYNIFKSSNTKVLSLYKNKSLNLKSTLLKKYLTISITTLICMFIFVIFDEPYFALFPILLLLPNTSDSVILINDSYISTLSITVPTKNSDYILIENPSYISSRIVLHTSDNLKKYRISISNKNLNLIKDTLRDFGYEVHIVP
ncbi:hypothetical protein [Clostridium sp.]|uniref:hypothetical protein n=1 Tax=Clostridium sp. TaxID=1506 RepID=UPI002FCA200B